MMRKYIEGIVHVEDPALVNWMKFFAERQKVVIEPTGCLGIAGLERQIEEGKIEDGARVGIIITGGNVDLRVFSELIFQDECNFS